MRLHRFGHLAPDSIPRLRNTRLLPSRSLLPAQLAHILPTDAKPLGQHTATALAALSGFQYPHPQIVRIGSSHARHRAQFARETSITYRTAHGYSYLDSALKASRQSGAAPDSLRLALAISGPFPAEFGWPNAQNGAQTGGECDLSAVSCSFCMSCSVFECIYTGVLPRISALFNSFFAVHGALPRSAGWAAIWSGRFL
jgi:hypothetical protein